METIECNKCTEDYPCDECISDHNDWLHEVMKDKEVFKNE